MIFPKGIFKEERTQAQILIKDLAPELAQQVLDEWAGIIAANAIRSSKLGCLRGLIARAEEGKFTAEKGLRIAASRKQQQRVARFQEHSRQEILPPSNPDNPLTQRINAIAARQQNKNLSK